MQASSDVVHVLQAAKRSLLSDREGSKTCCGYSSAYVPLGFSPPRTP
jgi:hypothetical protein